MPELEHRTYGEMTVLELVNSADSETAGLGEFIRKAFPKMTSDQSLIVNAYVGSIRARLIVAANKLAKE